MLYLSNMRGIKLNIITPIHNYVYKNILVPVDDQDQSYAAIRVAGMMASCEKSGFGIEPQVKLVESDNTAAEILDECGTGAYDVIVMGHRGRKTLKQLILGSVANGVLMEATCPVIMVHVPKGERE